MTGNKTGDASESSDMHNDTEDGWVEDFVCIFFILIILITHV